jgi:hypothetical protein
MDGRLASERHQQRGFKMLLADNSRVLMRLRTVEVHTMMNATVNGCESLTTPLLSVQQQYGFGLCCGW